VPFGVTYEKIGTIQRRLAWPLHKDDTLSRSGRLTGLNIYFAPATHPHLHCLYVPRPRFLRAHAVLYTTRYSVPGTWPGYDWRCN
ncbi:hypothetical protein GY45DRAFT_1405433, partial [Cubamyces sp. BRFM 1775]